MGLSQESFAQCPKAFPTNSGWSASGIGFGRAYPTDIHPMFRRYFDWYWEDNPCRPHSIVFCGGVYLVGASGRDSALPARRVARLYRSLTVAGTQLHIIASCSSGVNADRVASHISKYACGSLHLLALLVVSIRDLRGACTWLPLLPLERLGEIGLPPFRQHGCDAAFSQYARAKNR
jgi:hypothetical protein